jgi:hypothetical protein
MKAEKFGVLHCVQGWETGQRSSACAAGTAKASISVHAISHLLRVICLASSLNSGETLQQWRATYSRELIRGKQQKVAWEDQQVSESSRDATSRCGFAIFFILLKISLATALSLTA